MYSFLEFFLSTCIFIVVYTYFGYGIILIILVKIKRALVKNKIVTQFYQPNVTLLVAAYNEEKFITEKAKNSLSLHYPKNKIEIIFITDGSDDRTQKLVKNYPEIKLMHQPIRQGKVMAVERAMREVNGEIVIFTDANTLLNNDAISNITRHFSKENVGVVAGEKRIIDNKVDEAVGAGEGLYWKYESKLKKWDDELYSVMGAAGELFAIRTNLYETIPADTLIEDFYLSFKILQKGFKIAYEPDAYAIEGPSISVKEEFKRKTRIAAGGIQSIVRLRALLNPFKYGVVTFQYFSHRVLRWTLAPLAIPFIIILNALIIDSNPVYNYLFICQIIFYISAIIGLILEKKQLRFKILFIPYYFCMMNYAVFVGFWKYMLGTTTVLWEKSIRKEMNE